MTAVATTTPMYQAGVSRVRLVIGGFVGLIALLLLLHQAALVRAGFPVLGVATAFWVYSRAEFPAYMAFTWWFWFLTPGLRRIVDAQLGGWEPENPMSVAPLLVASIAVITVIRRLPELRRTRLWPWAVAILCILFGFFVGVLENGALPAIHSLMAWLIPLLFGLAIALEWRRYPGSAVQIRRVFVVGGLALSVYAVFQFLNPPLWDRLWVEGSGMTSVGFAFPYKLRVFSSMNGPLLFAVMLITSIFVALSSRGGVRIVAMVAALVALMLTLVRSVWLIAVPGIAIYLYALPMRSVRRAVVAGALAAGLLWALIVALPDEVGGPVVAMVQDRAFTLGSLNQDISYSERTGFMDQMGTVVLDNPLGHGLGSTGVSSTLGDPVTSMKDFDSGLFAVLYSLGWFAGAGLLIVTSYLVIAGLPRKESREDMMAKAARAVVVALFILNAGSNMFEGFAAMAFWGFAGLLVASHQYQEAVTASGPRVVRP